jgi:hypothetical protein
MTFSMWRVLVILFGLVAVERAADACCLGCPCTKYKDQRPAVLQQDARAYTHSVKGVVPGFSKITRFLTTGTWTPQPIVYKANDAQPIPGTTLVPPPTIRFVTADMADVPSKLPGQIVIVRRIEKHGSAILVEVDDRTFKLAACPKKPGFACLVEPGKLTLREIPPPGDGFAKPPAP